MRSVRDWNYDDMTDVNQNAIEVRVDDIAQLFHTLDPFPSGIETWIEKPRNTLSVGPVNYRYPSQSNL